MKLAVVDSNVIFSGLRSSRLRSLLPSSLVFVDEREARKWARRLQIPAVGTLGILLRAKHEGCLPSLKTAMEEPTRNYGFAISPVLLDRALIEVGESSH